MSENGTMKKRLYIVRPEGSKVLADTKARLIRATSQAAALKFALDGIYEVDLAGPEEVAELVFNGAKIEDAV